MSNRNFWKIAPFQSQTFPTVSIFKKNQPAAQKTQIKQDTQFSFLHVSAVNRIPQGVTPKSYLEKT